jgi:hypothetical protein
VRHAYARFGQGMVLGHLDGIGQHVQTATGAAEDATLLQPPEGCARDSFGAYVARAQETGPAHALDQALGLGFCHVYPADVTESIVLSISREVL